MIIFINYDYISDDDFDYDIDDDYDYDIDYSFDYLYYDTADVYE